MGEMVTDNSLSGDYSTHSDLNDIEFRAPKRSRIMPLSSIVPSLLFKEAAEIWFTARAAQPAEGRVSRRYMKLNTSKSYAQYIRSLNLYFGDIALEKITLGNIIEYQEARLNGDPPFIRKRRPNSNVEAASCPASPKKVNQELCIAIKLLKRSGCWPEEMDEDYETLIEDESDIPKALTMDERQHWLDTAMSKPEWELVHWYSILALETSMGTNEMRALRIGDVNLHHRTVRVPPHGAKHRERIRTIPLISGDVLWAAQRLLDRAKELGADSPLHFLFPFRKMPYPFDPSMPMTVSGIYGRWGEVRKASGLKSFTPYHTRHTALTNWAEGGMRIEEMMALAGHLSPKMTRHYARISEGALRKSLENVMRRKAPRSVGVLEFESKKWG